jgi:putative ABC transport system permease protein
MLTDLFIYSLRNLKNRKLRSWLTMLGIIIGISSVIALIGLGNGLRTAIVGQFGGISVDVLTIQAGGVNFAGPPGTTVVNPLKQYYVDDIERISSIDFAAARIIETVRVDFNNRQRILSIITMPEGYARRQVENIANIKAEKGRLLKDDDRYAVVLGNNFNRKENGFDRTINVGNNIRINDGVFEVVGIMDKVGSFIFDNVILMNENVLREMSENKDNVNIIVARVRSINDVDRAKEAIERYLRKERNVRVGEEDFNVETAGSTLDSVNDILGGVQAFVIIIAAISMVVGALGIINTMFTSVMERRKEIGIMKSIGAQNKDIFLLFFIESGLLGAIGGFLGILFGILFSVLGTNALNNFLGTSVQPVISFSLILFSLIGSFILGALSGVVPAMQAAKMNPVDALRS